MRVAYAFRYKGIELMCSSCYGRIKDCDARVFDKQWVIDMHKAVDGSEPRGVIEEVLIFEECKDEV